MATSSLTSTVGTFGLWLYQGAPGLLTLYRWGRRAVGRGDADPKEPAD